MTNKHSLGKQPQVITKLVRALDRSLAQKHTVVNPITSAASSQVLSLCFQKTESEAESALRWEAANKTLLLAIVASDARDTRSALFCLKRAEEHCDVRYLCSGVGGRERDADNSSLLMTAYSLLTLTPACLTIC